MPIGTCDPATRGEAFNVAELAQGEGPDVYITIRYGWDGTSTRDTNGGCNGPVEDIRVRNVSAVSYWAHLPNKKKGTKLIEIPPGTDTTLSGGQLNSLGLQQYADCMSVTLTTSSTPG